MVRNFWIDANIEGRQTMLSGGPRRKDGGMSVYISQRKDGEIITPIQITCYEHNGILKTTVTINGIDMPTVVTER